jgi:hypothetical protein
VLAVVVRVCSFSTSEDTLSYLSKYPTLVADPNLELMQNKVRRPDRLSKSWKRMCLKPSWIPHLTAPVSVVFSTRPPSLKFLSQTSMFSEISVSNEHVDWLCWM